MSTCEADAPSSRSRLSSGLMSCLVLLLDQLVTMLEPQSMDKVCLVLAILDLYMVGVNTRNLDLLFLI